MNYLIRHAEKTDASVHARLSDKGKIDSIEYGKELSKSDITINQIVTSPIERCTQTAEFISEGLNYNVPIVKAIELGDPGVYISDDKKAMDTFNSYTLLEIVNMQLSRESLAGFHDIDASSEKLKRFFSLFDDATLFISHDAIIIPYINWVKQINKISDTDLVEYLYTYALSEKTFHM